MEGVLTGEMWLEAFEFEDSFSQRYYYPVHLQVWGSFLEAGFSDKQLTDWGFLKSDYIEPSVEG